ncbi:MAG TPA: 3-phosphoshikimate 1-carboxyvinyltransferase, partial [Anaerolineae bacterium]|nr:3-phosphoshikimate 1-carboxyvinyltransferase [Anaerolineae bacterium]
EPDASNASYFLAAAAVTGGRVRVNHLSAQSCQGDTRFVEVLAAMGCQVKATAAYIEVIGPEKLQGVDVDMNDMSDLVQTLAAIAPFASSPVIIRNVEHIRWKETERLQAVVTELQRLGAIVEEFADGLKIYPSPLRPAAIETYDDHRMAMAFAVTGLKSPGVIIKQPDCTAKTFPDFFTRFFQMSEGGRK